MRIAEFFVNLGVIKNQRIMEEIYGIYNKLKEKGYEVHERFGFYLVKKDGEAQRLSLSELMKLANV